MLVPMSQKPSGRIDIKRLERESRKFFYTGMCIAVVLHSLLFVFVTFERILVEPEPPRIIKLRLIDSRLIEPFIIAQRTVTKKRLERRVYSRRKPTGEVETVTPPDITVDHETPMVDVVVETPDEVVMLDGVDIDLGASRAPNDRVPLKNRMLVDPGDYKSEIIYNPDEAMSIQGFVHIPIVKFDDYNPTDKMRLAIFGLADAVNRMTNIAAVVDNLLPKLKFNILNPLRALKEDNVRGMDLDSLFIKRPPLVYILANDPFELSKSELRNFEIYLKGNGIVFLENGMPGNRKYENKLKSILTNMVIGPKLCYFLESETYPAFEEIPLDHPLYDCFFDFKQIQPQGASQKYGAVPYKMSPCLEGLWIDDRLVAIYSDRGYGLMWDAETGNREQRRMGVNMVVFSLLQQRNYHRSDPHAFRIQ